MTRLLRFVVPAQARRGGGDLNSIYHSSLARHWPTGRRATGALLRAAHGAAATRELAGRDDLGPADLATCWRWGLLPRELAAARRDLPGQPLEAVVPAHVAKGVYQLLNRGAWPLGGNLLLDKARFGRVMRDAGLPVPAGFGAGDCVRRLADAPALIWKPGFMSQGRGIRKVERAPCGSWRLPGGTACLETWAARSLRPGDVVQRFLAPHPALAERSPGALPTLRIITCLDAEDAPEVALAILRMGGGGGFLDNFHGGGLAASLDLRTGTTLRAATMRPGLRLHSLETHPATGAALTGFAVPFLTDCLEIARAAHRVVARHGFEAVGWDVGLSEDGPVLIEGNWSPGTPISQYLAGEAIGTARLGQLLAERLRRLPAERWRAAAALASSARCPKQA